ncbi:MAG: hypothetical protein QW590_02220 [Candidatus Bilamarchaeaceae archaeon]
MFKQPESSDAKPDEHKEIEEVLLKNCRLYPPMPFFEKPKKTAEELMSSLLIKIKRLEKKQGEFLEWVKGALRAAGEKLSLIFFGRAIYSEKECSDVDILMVYTDPTVQNEVRDLCKPYFVHTQSIFKGAFLPFETTAGYPRFFVANTMLIYPKETNSFVLYSIRRGRKLIKNASFFNGGIGDLITYAASKIIERKETQHFDCDKEQIERILNKNLVIMNSDCFGFAASPENVNAQTRNELRMGVREGRFERSEIEILARAAMRRIGIKESQKTELTKKFLRALKV